MSKSKAGRPKFKVTPENIKQVELLSGLGVPQEQIASIIGCSVDTMVLYFKEQLVNGKAKANSQIGQMLFKKALGGDTTALIFWAKTQMRFKETSVQEIGGIDGKPIEISEAKARLLAGTKPDDNK